MGHKILPRVPPEGPNERWYNDLENAFQQYRVTLTPASVAANTTIEQVFPVTGVNSEALIILTPPSLTAGIGIAGVRSSAKDEISITFINTTVGALTPPSGEYMIISIRG